jgi:phosphohistidine phosphatase
MELYLVQHGAAKSEAEDPQRSLTTDGRLTVERLADFLIPVQLSLDRIEHSDKLRAKQTAEILAERLRSREGTKEIRGMAPNDEVEPMRSRLQGEWKNLMLVGHLPYLGRLVARLLGVERDQDAVQFQMGGLVRLDRHKTGHWVVHWMIMPDLFLHR